MIYLWIQSYTKIYATELQTYNWERGPLTTGTNTVFAIHSFLSQKHGFHVKKNIYFMSCVERELDTSKHKKKSPKSLDSEDPK